MKKLLSVLVLCAVGAGVYFYLHPKQTQDLLEGTPLESDGGSIRVYKWQNAQGDWQVTDGPPPQGVAYELKEFRPEIVQLPLPPAPEQ